MVLLQISEPGEPTTAANSRQLALGIDLGTTNSLVAHFDGTDIRVLQDETGRAALPSVVYYGAEDTAVGYAAEAFSVSEPASTVASAKRLLGRGREEFSDDPYLTLTPEGVLAFATAAGEKTPVEVSSAILTALKCRAERQLGGAIAGAVITVPAYFDDAQRQATRQAAELSGIKVLRLLNEPTAAAVAYGLDADSEEASTLAVYDLGGGTFDISILRMREGLFEVLATGGDSALGGDDFDRAITDFWLKELELAQPSVGQRRSLLGLARRAKEMLSTQQTVSMDCHELDLACDQLRLSRESLDDLVSGLIDKTLQACEAALADAGLESVDRVVLVGGSTRMPRVREAVAACFG